MAALSKILRNAEGNILNFKCPGCNMVHGIRYGTDPQKDWYWNGDAEKPTFHPSILVEYEHMSIEGSNRSRAFYKEHGRYLTREELPYDLKDICHSFVTNGRIQFLSDCTHALANQTVDLPEWT